MVSYWEQLQGECLYNHEEMTGTYRLMVEIPSPDDINFVCLWTNREYMKGGFLNV